MYARRASCASIASSTRRAASSLAVRSPRDGRIFAELPDWSASEVDAAVAKAVGVSQTSWAAPSSVESRVSSLRALASALRRDAERLAALETLDCGKPIGESRADMGGCADLCDYYASIAPEVKARVRDLSLVGSIEALDLLVADLVRRVHEGDTLYIHCWGGRGPKLLTNNSSSPKIDGLTNKSLIF